MKDPPEVRNTLSGSADTVLQAGSIHGDVNILSRHRLPKPHQLPPPPADFVNRGPVIRQLTGASTTERPGHRALVATVAGAPGVGKTAVALQWAHDAKKNFPDGNLYVDMHGYSAGHAISANQALDAFLRALDIPAGKIPEDVDSRASLFRSMVGDKAILILADNVSSADQVRHLIPSSPRCFVLITSRSRLRGLTSREGAVRLQVDTLSPADAMSLLSRLIGAARVGAEPRAAERMAELCGFLPLALRVLAERTASRPNASLESVVGELVGEQNRLDVLASEEDELSDTRAVFSWSYGKLSPDLAATFRVLALHPGRQFSTAAAAALTGSSVAAARRMLRQLSDVHLLAEGDDRFVLHDLLFSYALERVMAEETQESRTRASRRVLSWYVLAADACRKAILPHSLEFPLVPRADLVVSGFADSEAAGRWFADERLNLLAAIRTADEIGQYDICWKLASVTSSMFEIQCYWTEWEQNHHLGLAAAEALGDKLGTAAHTALLGDISFLTGRLDDADLHYHKALEMARDLGLGWLEGFMLRGLGRVAERESRNAQAADLLNDAVATLEEAGHGRGVAMSMLSLGNVWRKLNDHPRSIEICGRAVDRLEQLGDPWSAARARSALAGSLRADGQERKAIEEWRSAAEVFRRFSDKLGEAAALVEIGAAVRRLRNRQSPRKYWSQALRLYEELDDPRAAEVREMIDSLDN